MRTQFICLVLVIVLVCPFASAQWVQTNGPYAGCIRAFASCGTNLFAATDGGVLISTNKGTSWAAVNNGLSNTQVNALAVSGTNLFAGTWGGVFLTTNSGASWTAVDNGLPNSRVNALAVSGTNLFAAPADSGVFLSTNNGTSWTPVNKGLPPCNVPCLAANDSNLFAGIGGGYPYDGVARSTNNGQTWSNPLWNRPRVGILVLSGTILFAGSDSLLRSTNYGGDWTAVDGGSSGQQFAGIGALVARGDTLLVGSGNWRGAFLSTTSGEAWTPVNTGLMNPVVTALAACPNGNGGTNLFAGTDGSGIYCSTNSGASWTNVSPGVALACVQGFFVSGTDLFARTYYMGSRSNIEVTNICVSTNEGTTWTELTTSMPKEYPHNYEVNFIAAFAAAGSNLFYGTLGAGIFLSTNSGATWTAVNEGLPRLSWDSTRYEPVQCLALSGQTLYAGTYGGVYLSTNNGLSWTAVDTTLTSVNVFAFSGTNLFAGNWDGVFLSTNAGTIWTSVNTGLTGTVYALAVSRTNLFAAIVSEWGSGELHSRTGHGVFLSTNNGTSWNQVNTDLTDTLVNALAVSGTNLFAGTPSGVFLSTNNGASWTEVNAGLQAPVGALAVNGPFLYAGVGGYRVYRGGVWRRPLSEMITSVPISSTILPTVFSLDQNYPNPFNPGTTIKYELPKSSTVTLSVYDILGREVSVLVKDERDAGVHEVKFDGGGLSSGAYFYRLRAGNFVETRRLMLVR